MHARPRRSRLRFTFYVFALAMRIAFVQVTRAAPVMPKDAVVCYGVEPRLPRMLNTRGGVSSFNA